MELAKGIIIPVLADSVLSPDVYYCDAMTGIYFQTHDDNFGRITFHNLDAIKVCRGEELPYTDDWEIGQELPWVYKVENSKWLNERFDYEKKHYGSSYEFGGNVDEMLTDFSHYVFKFHDQFIEIISRGFWFEKDVNSLFNKGLMNGHPFLPLPEKHVETIEVAGIKCKIIVSPVPVDNLIENAKYCEQKLIEFSNEFEGKFSIHSTLVVMWRQGKMISILRQFFGRPVFEKQGLATIEDVQPLVEKELEEIAARRKQIHRKKG